MALAVIYYCWTYFSLIVGEARKGTIRGTKNSLKCQSNREERQELRV